ncbi:MAG: hypothetical protein EBR79_00255 [Proteobacteria bacterium]|nr:hypothetical protein [Pseudomonadota bacterium]NBX86408.1 hypothetical protein [Pseudomonadota bacterium]
MVLNIQGLKGPQAADKAKGKAKVGEGGAKFAELLEAAQTGETPAPAPTFGLGVQVPVFGLADEVPRDAKGQARELLKTLREVADAALGGENMQRVQRLEALANEVDESTLSSTQKEALAEVRTRAAVEVAKLKG